MKYNFQARVGFANLTFLAIFVCGLIFATPLYATASDAHDSVSIEVSTACTIGAINNTHSASIGVGSSKNIGGDTTFSVACSDWWRRYFFHVWRRPTFNFWPNCALCSALSLLLLSLHKLSRLQPIQSILSEIRPV